MATPLLSYQPVRDGYSLTPGYNCIDIKLDGGPSRKRQDFIGEPHLLNVQWIIVKNHYSNFMAFFRERIQNGTMPFRATILGDSEVLIPNVCQCADGLPKLTQQSGDAFWLSTTLEVTPNPTKSFSLFLQNVSVEQVVDAGTVDYAGEMAQFPAGRSVVLTGTSETVSGTPINLDGTYVIDTEPNAFTRTLQNASTINSDWTVLNGTGAQSYFPTNGACILVPV